MSEEKQNGLTRRKFLVGAGALAAGAVVGGSVVGAVNLNSAEAAAQPLPWAYTALDPAAVMRSAYNNYAIGGCCYAVGKALVDALVTAAGTPWDTIPTDMFKYGKGGVISWGALCGTLNGALLVINMVAGASSATVGSELMGWYTGFAFPSTAMDAYATYQGQPQYVCKSPLCHQSASIWSDSSGFKINSPERKERCAKVAGDVAFKTVELLNAWKAGSLLPAFQHDPAYARCFDCHIGAASKYDNVQGQMNCLQSGCHDDKTTHHI